MSVKDKIKQRRIELGLTMLDVAQAVGVSESTVSRWESGDISNMRQDRIMSLCQTLRSTPTHLFGWPSITAIARPASDSSEPLSDIDTIVCFSSDADCAKLSDELMQKIARLDETDRSKIEAYTDGLLAADKYHPEPTYQIKIAARGGGVKEITVTDSQLQAIKNLPEVTDLGNSDNLK